MAQRVIGLFSGGKDSVFNLMECVKHGHTVVALANLSPAELKHDEQDSYMFQTIGHSLVPLLAKAMDLPLFSRQLRGTSKSIGKQYTPCEGDEVEDLFEVLQTARDATEATAVASGAIFSDYQRVRVEHVCARLGLLSLAMLWRRPQPELLHSMVESGVHAILVKTAGLGLTPKAHLGKSLAQLQLHLLALGREYGVNVCGEGGEYETLVLDSPLFTQTLVLDETTLVGDVTETDPFMAPVGVLRVGRAHLEPKPREQTGRRPVEVTATHGGHLDGLHTAFVAADAGQGEHKLAARATSLLVSVCSALRKHSLSPSAAVFVFLTLPTMEAFGMVNALYLRFLSVHANEKEVHSQSPCTACQQFCRLSEKLASTGAKHAGPFQCVVAEPPSRACVATGSLSVDVFAARCGACTAHCTHCARGALHVQSISAWAPCSIGPYSQARWVRDTALLAGQIALAPLRMTMVTTGVQEDLTCFALEARTALRHCRRVLACVEGQRDVAMLTAFASAALATEEPRARWEGVMLAAVREPALQQADRTAEEPSSPKLTDLSCVTHANAPSEEDEKAFVTANTVLAFVWVPCLPKQARLEFVPLAFKAPLETQRSSVHGKDCTLHVTTVRATGCALTTVACEPTENALPAPALRHLLELLAQETGRRSATVAARLFVEGAWMKSAIQLDKKPVDCHVVPAQRLSIALQGEVATRSVSALAQVVFLFE